MFFNFVFNSYLIVNNFEVLFLVYYTSYTNRLQFFKDLKMKNKVPPTLDNMKYEKKVYISVYIYLQKTIFPKILT